MRSIDTLLIKNTNLDMFKPYKIDCEKCCGLCCVALFFSKTDGFPENKGVGKVCKNLNQSYRCQIHAQLYQQGLKGCMAYDCFGAGQRTTQKLAQKPDWKTLSKKEAEIAFNSYLKILKIHQTLWYLTEALILRLSEQETEQIDLLLKEGTSLAEQPLEDIQTMNIEPFREKANKLLKYICESITAKCKPQGKIDRDKNYLGKNLKQKDLTGKDFSMALLIAANLEQANLYGANFLGADMRGVNIQNTDLSHSLFLTQIQINGAKGNGQTVLPPYLDRPTFWGMAKENKGN